MAVKVLHVVTYMGRGGLETMIMNYYRKIDRDKVQFDFLVHREFEADYEKEISELGGNIYRVPGLNPFSPAYYRALDCFFAKHEYDVVHSHLDCLSAYPLRSAKKHGVRVRIAHAHNTRQDWNLKYPIKILSKCWIPYYATHLFACGEEAGKWMFGKHPFTIVNNAIDARCFRYSPEREISIKERLGVRGRFVLGHVGRFSPQKNHDFLIDVFQAVLAECSDAVLLLIGTGDGQYSIEEKVAGLGILDKVRFLGNRDDVADLLQAMDIFVFPSLYEGLSVAAVEAQASGVPCVMSDQVPAECKVCSNVEFISLKESVSVWAKQICKWRDYKKADTYKEICDRKFDISGNVAWLEKFYLAGEDK